ncbi:MAG: hypothetical protein ABW166_09720 [Sedimenticola sp.]
MFKYLVIACILAPSLCYANGKAEGKITGYVINEDSVYVSSDASTANIHSTCNTLNRFYFSQNSAHAKVFISAILAAYQAGTDLSLNGTGNCVGGNEVLRKICTVGISC